MVRYKPLSIRAPWKSQMSPVWPCCRASRRMPNRGARPVPVPASRSGCAGACEKVALSAESIFEADLRGLRYRAAGAPDKTGLARPGFAGVRDRHSAAEQAIEHALALLDGQIPSRVVNCRHVGLGLLVQD